MVQIVQITQKIAEELNLKKFEEAVKSVSTQFNKIWGTQIPLTSFANTQKQTGFAAKITHSNTNRSH